MSTEEAIAVVRRNTEEVQGKGNYQVFEGIVCQGFCRPHTATRWFQCRSRRSTEPLQRPTHSLPRFSRRNPLANFGWRSRDHVQNIPRDAPRRVLGHSPNGKEDSIRDCRCHASAKRQDQRSLGSGEPILARAAVRTYSSTKEGITIHQQNRCSFVTRDIL